MTTELQQRKLAHDFANEGDCPYCGDLQVLIDQGKVKPCFQWERPAIPEQTEEGKNPKDGNGTWDGC